VSVRAALKSAVGRLAASPAFAWRTRRELARRVDVIYYHFVGGVTPWYADFYAGATLERLDRDLGLLGRWFRFASLRKVVEGAPGGDRPLLAVTFDDGFDVVRMGALDVLESHGVAATTFVITSCVGNERLMWRNKLSAARAQRGAETCVRAYNQLAARNHLAPISDGRELMAASRVWPMARKDELADALWEACEMPPLSGFLDEQRPYLGWDDLEAWLERGHSVGLHTRTHPDCARLEPGAEQAEIVGPARELRERLGLEWLPLSYPFGARLEVAREQRLSEEGVFDCAFGIDGFAPAGTAPRRLERAAAERDLGYEVFGRAFTGRPRLR
jgi:peptidoglycan/xylan/chitin deacetylase (PgdA/CDA1 family)